MVAVSPDGFGRDVPASVVLNASFQTVNARNEAFKA
jgi:hypothetical protein